MSDNVTSNEVLLSVSNVNKCFGNNEVLKGISLNLKRGEVLSIIGGNGAGKSTLMKIIMGIYKPDSGEVFVDGDKLSTFKPSESLSKGVYMVPQEPMLFPNITVEENILIGFKESYSILHKRLIGIMKEIGWKIDLNRKALSLSIAEQQIVELLRGLMRNSKILILDEPTSALTFEEVGTLFETVKGLKEKGIGIIYITHRLSEVFYISTSVSIMRDGIITANGPISQFTKDMLINALLPINKENANCKKDSYVAIDYENAKQVFRLENYCGYGFEDISFELYEGEILGIAGLVGAGRTELVTTVFGRDKVLSGKAYLYDKDITGFKTKDVIKLGINYVPEDRKLNGIFKISDVAANTTSSLMIDRLMGRFLLNKNLETEITEKYINEFRTKVTSQKQLAGSLSGGNQQKIAISRILATKPKVIILDEPTRGIDAAARGDVYSIIKELKKSGVSIILISSDMEEIIELSDRAIVMFQGHKRAELKKEHINQTELMNASFNIC